jgi:hypothetical protein
MLPPAAFADLRERAVYQQENVHVYPSRASLNWAIRTNRQRLVEAGAIVELSGKVFVVPSRFEAEMLKIGTENVVKRAGRPFPQREGAAA